MTSLNRQAFATAAVILFFGSPFFDPQDATAGTITITKNVMTDKTNNVDVTSGWGDAALSVQFKGAATCTCENPNITYTWNYGDGTNDNGATVSHTYGAAGAGTRHRIYIAIAIIAVLIMTRPIQRFRNKRNTGYADRRRG